MIPAVMFTSMPEICVCMIMIDEAIISGRVSVSECVYIGVCIRVLRMLMCTMCEGFALVYRVCMLCAYVVLWSVTLCIQVVVLVYRTYMV